MQNNQPENHHPDQNQSQPEKELVKQQFGANAAAYATSKVHAKGASLARLVELVQPQLDWQALDIATAAGHTAHTFAPHVAHVVATDITPEMLQVAEKVGAEKGIENVSLEIADAEDLPYEDGHFDLVTCRIAPHHFPNIGRFLRECARVLRPDGILAIVDNVVPGDLPAAGEYVNAFEKLRDPSHNRALSLEEWVAAFEDAGLKVVHYETAPKEMEFQWWAERMTNDTALVERLRAMLLDAPAEVTAFLTPRTQDGELLFYLTEAILIAQKA